MPLGSNVIFICWNATTSSSSTESESCWSCSITVSTKVSDSIGIVHSLSRGSTPRRTFFFGLFKHLAHGVFSTMSVSDRVYWSGWAARGCMAYVLCSESWIFDCTVSFPSNEAQQTYLTATNPPWGNKSDNRAKRDPLQTSHTSKTVGPHESELGSLQCHDLHHCHSNDKSDGGNNSGHAGLDVGQVRESCVLVTLVRRVILRV